MNSYERTTRGIVNKDFSGMRKVVARFNFYCNLTGNRPQSLTGHITTVSCKFTKYQLKQRNKTRKL